MPLRRNESASQKTLTFKRLDAYFKDNYALSRETGTVFTDTSSDAFIDLKPKFVFKGKGTKTILKQATVIKFQ